MERIANCWLWLSTKFHHRPLAVMGVLLGAFIWVGLMIWLFVQTENTQGEIERVQGALCGGMIERRTQTDLPPVVQRNCQLLFDRIFENATPEQLRNARLRLNP